MNIVRSPSRKVLTNHQPNQIIVNSPSRTPNNDNNIDNDSPLPSTSRERLNQPQTESAPAQITDYRNYKINPYSKMPVSNEHRFVVPWCRNIDQYVLPPRLDIPVNLDHKLKENLDIHTLLKICRTIDEDHHFRRPRLTNVKYCSILFFLFMSVLFIGTGISLGMYFYLTPEPIFLYAAIVLGSLFIVCFLLRFAVLGCKKSTYRSAR